MTAAWLPSGWKLKSEGVILPEDRLSAVQTVIVGLQHVVAMFGGTVLAPILMGFDPNVVMLFSGVGTLIFFVAVGGRVPSFLGSSFSFIAAVIAVTAYAGPGLNPNAGIAHGGIIAAGALYALIGIAVVLAGHSWVEALMPPVVTGAVVAVIGLSLAPLAVKGISGSAFDMAIAVITVLTIGGVAVLAPQFWRRIPILIGGTFTYLLYWVLANGLGFGMPINFHRVADAAWLGTPNFSEPVFDIKAMTMIAPVAIILVAENLGHIKALNAMIGRNLDSLLGRAFIGDGIATIVAAACGGAGVTTYAENIGVMGMTKVYSTLVFVVAATFAILLGFSPKFGALILTIPGSVVGGLSIVLFGLIAGTAGRIWVENSVDFSKASNLIIVGVSLVVGAGGLTLEFGEFIVGSVTTASLGAIILYQLLRDRSDAEAGEEKVHIWATHSELARATGQAMAERATASVAHEIRQPLAAITANADAAMHWLERTPPNLGEAREALTSIVSDGHRANEIVESVQTIFKRRSQQRIALDVNKVIRDVLKVLNDELQRHKITVQSELIDGLPSVLADRVQLQQVILNLAMNAIETMSSVVSRARILRIKSAIYKADGVLVSVEDSGSGINPEDIERIFDAFFTTKALGMGMGLSICRSIIEAHGGRIWATSGNGHGAVLNILLPAVTAGIDK